eukprot:scaffold152632_cov22-Tisochrysis_lutea.AAC.1
MRSAQKGPLALCALSHNVIVMDSALHVLSDCKLLIIRNTVTECHIIVYRMILKVVSKCSQGSNYLAG